MPESFPVRTDPSELPQHAPHKKEHQSNYFETGLAKLQARMSGKSHETMTMFEYRAIHDHLETKLDEGNMSSEQAVKIKHALQEVWQEVLAQRNTDA